MANQVMKYWDGLPNWSKGIIAVGGLAAVYFGVRGFINKLKKDAAMGDVIKTQQNQEQELQDNIDNNIVPTFPMSQFTQWADELQNQFDGCDSQLHLPNIDPNMFEPVIGNWSGSGQKLASIILEFKNDSDFLALSTAWGPARVYDQCGWSPFGDGNFTGNLSQSVTDELDNQEIRALNNYLASKNIKYRF